MTTVQWPEVRGRIETVHEVEKLVGQKFTRANKKLYGQYLSRVYSTGSLSFFELGQRGLYLSPHKIVDVSFSATREREDFLDEIEYQLRGKFEPRDVLGVSDSRERVLADRAKPKTSPSAAVKTPVLQSSSKVAKSAAKSLQPSRQSLAEPSSVASKSSGKKKLLPVVALGEAYAKFLTPSQLTQDRPFVDVTRDYVCPLHFSGEVLVHCSCGRSLGDMLNIPFVRVDGCVCPESHVVGDVCYVKRRQKKFSQSHSIVVPHVQAAGVCATKHPFGDRLSGLRDKLPVLASATNEVFRGVTDYRVTNVIFGGSFMSGFHAVLMLAVVAYRCKGAFVVPLQMLSGLIGGKLYGGMLRHKREFDVSVSRMSKLFRRVNTLENFVHIHFPSVEELSLAAVAEAVRTLPVSFFPSAAKKPVYACPHHVVSDTLQDVSVVDVRRCVDVVQSFPAKLCLSELYCRASAAQRDVYARVDRCFSGEKLESLEEIHSGVLTMSQVVGTVNLWDKVLSSVCKPSSAYGVMTRLIGLHQERYGTPGLLARRAVCGHVVGPGKLVQFNEFYGAHASIVRDHFASVFNGASLSELMDLMSYLVCRVDVMMGSVPGSARSRVFSESTSAVPELIEFALDVV